MNKNIKTLCREAAVTLRAAGIENAAAEARWLAGHFFCRSAAEFTVDFTPADSSVSEFIEAVQKRAAGEPLQYIMGTQDFMGLALKVGRGVLIPRPETELLVRVGANAVPGAKVVWDLCAGSGCVGLGLRTLLPGVKVFFVEKYAAALKILRENVGENDNCTIVRADLLTSLLAKLPDPDLILCNPPYIPGGDIPALQREVLREPKTALDGGDDGLLFYPVLAELAARRLKEGGALCAELGIGQSGAVTRLFYGFHTSIYRDEAGIERVISAEFT